MPKRSPKPCKLCGKATTNSTGYCDTCNLGKKEKDKAYDRHRGSASSRGYNAQWRRLREHFLSLNPLCCECERKGIIEPATDVDHIIPHKGNPVLFNDIRNLQALCHSCHSRKTAMDDGGLGN